jgi:hypothetical protein
MSTEESTMASYETVLEQVTALLTPLCTEDKMAFLTQYSKMLSKEVKKNLKSKARKQSSTTNRKVGAGTYAWIEYEKTLMAKEPDLFEGIRHFADRKKITSQYKKDHPEEYNAFVEKYKEDLAAGLIEPPMSEKRKKKLALLSEQVSADVPTTVVVEEKPSKPVVQQTTSQEKLEKMKKTLESKAEAKPLPPVKFSNVTTAEPSGEEKPKKSVVKKVSAASKGKKEVVSSEDDSE